MTFRTPPTRDCAVHDNSRKDEVLYRCGASVQGRSGGLDPDSGPMAEN